MSQSQTGPRIRGIARGTPVTSASPSAAAAAADATKAPGDPEGRLRLDQDGPTDSDICVGF